MLRLRREIVRVFARSLCSILLDHDIMWRAWFLDLSKKMLRVFYVAIFLMYIREFTCCCFARVMPEQCGKKTCIIMVKRHAISKVSLRTFLDVRFAESRRCLSVLKLKNFDRKYQLTAYFKTKYQTSKLSLWTVVATAVAARAVVTNQPGSKRPPWGNIPWVSKYAGTHSMQSVGRNRLALRLLMVFAATYFVDKMFLEQCMCCRTSYVVSFRFFLV